MVAHDALHLTEQRLVLARPATGEEKQRNDQKKTDQSPDMGGI